MQGQIPFFIPLQRSVSTARVRRMHRAWWYPEPGFGPTRGGSLLPAVVTASFLHISFSNLAILTTID